MQTSFKIFLALSTTLALGPAACTELAADADADQDDFGDGVIGYRYDCPGDIRCPENSPWVGNYAFSNFPRAANISKKDPFDNATLTWTSATKIISGVTQPVTLEVSDEGQLSAVPPSNLPTTITGVKFAFTISKDGAPDETGYIYFRDESRINGTHYTISLYDVLTDIEPTVAGSNDFPAVDEDEESLKDLYPICPQGAGTNRAIVLKNVNLEYDGAMAVLSSDSDTFVLACERQALAKGSMVLGVLPKSGSRQYGVDNYNALVNAYRAFHDGDARTYQGAQVFLQDLAHDPPMFDQVDLNALPPTPILGYYDFFLESVYDGSSGANCRSYTDKFPYGVHRNASFSPPGLVSSSWDDLENCDDNTNGLGDYGPVAAYVIKFVSPFAPPPSS